MCNDWWENFPLPFLWIIDFPLLPMLFAVPLELNMLAVFGFESYLRWQKSTLQGTYISFDCVYMSLCVSRGIPKAWSWAHFGQGSGPIQLDAVQCTGNELSLDECRHSGWEQHNCDHMEDAGVSCNPYTGLILYIDTHIQALIYLDIWFWFVFLIIFCAVYLNKPSFP